MKTAADSRDIGKTLRNQSYALIALTVTLFSGCSGGGSGSGNPVPLMTATPLPTSAPTPTPTTSSQVIIASYAHLLQEGLAIPVSNGAQVFQNGDSSTGGQGAIVDGISCNAGMAVNYHIHAHVSILNGNTQAYMPQAVGLYQPNSAFGTFPNTYQEEGTCAYGLHTHDHSGILHIETSAPPSQPYTLGQFFDIWGQPLTTTQVAGLSGPVTVYITSTTADASGVEQPSLSPKVWTGPLTSIPLIAHQEITIVVGSSTLPLPRYIWPSNL